MIITGFLDNLTTGELRKIMSCNKTGHNWKCGWECENCGKRKSDVEEFKKVIAKKGRLYE